MPTFQNHGPVRLRLLRFTDRRGAEQTPESENYLVIGTFPSKDRIGTGYYCKAGNMHVVELETMELAAGGKFKFHILQDGKRSTKPITPMLVVDTEAGRITGAYLLRPGTSFCANFINEREVTVAKPSVAKPTAEALPSLADVIETHENPSSEDDSPRTLPTMEDLVEELENCERSPLENMRKAGFRKFKKFKIIQQIMKKRHAATTLFGTRPEPVTSSIKRWRRHYSRRAKYARPAARVRENSEWAEPVYM